MAKKAVAVQYVGVIHSRPLDVATDGTTGSGRFAVAADTGILAKLGSYNRPAAPGDTIYTSQTAIYAACLAVIRLEQLKLGVNARGTIFGKTVGTPPTGNRLSVGDGTVAGRSLSAGELAELVYTELDFPSAGLHDAIKYANSVPTASGGIVIRSEAGPETMPTDSELVSGI